MAQKTLKLKGVTAVGFFVGDYYLRPENMRLQKKYTICLEFHVQSTQYIYYSLEYQKSDGIVTTTILPDSTQTGHDVVTTNKVTKRNLFTTHCVYNIALYTIPFQTSTIHSGRTLNCRMADRGTYLYTNIISEYCVIAMQNFEYLTF